MNCVQKRWIDLPYLGLETGSESSGEKALYLACRDGRGNLVAVCPFFLLEAPQTSAVPRIATDEPHRRSGDRQSAGKCL